MKEDHKNKEIEKEDNSNRKAVPVFLTDEEIVLLDEACEQANRKRANFIYNMLKIQIFDKSKK